VEGAGVGPDEVHDARLVEVPVQHLEARHGVQRLHVDEQGAGRVQVLEGDDLQAGPGAWLRADDDRLGIEPQEP